MRAGYVAANSENYLLRHPVGKHINYNGSGVAPHVGTIRATYTVPTGKSALWVLSSINVLQITAPSSASRVYAYTRLTLNGVVLTVDHSLLVLSAGLPFNAHDSVNPQVFMAAGDKAEIVTQDNSTGGTWDYLIGDTFIEFDA